MSKETILAIAKILDDAAKKHGPELTLKGAVRWANVEKERVKLVKEQADLEERFQEISQRLKR